MGKSIKITLSRLFYTSCLFSSLVTAQIPSENSLTYPIWQGPTSNLTVALTFDDGPKPEFAVPLLDLLDTYGVRATFFLVGESAEKYPDIVYRMAESHHEIANHSYSHHSLDTMSTENILHEIDLTNRILFKITRSLPIFFRPPGGRYNRRLLNTVAEFDMRTVLWDVNAEDYVLENDPHKLSNEPIISKGSTKKVLASIQPGSIILLHNGGPKTMKAVPLIIEGLQKRGYSFVTLKDLLN